MRAVDLGFPGGIGLRLVAVAVFAGLALAGVLLVEHGAATHATNVATIASSTHGRLTLEATFPVARWTVQVQGQTIAGSSPTSQKWEAQVSGDGASIFVQADTEDPTSSAPGALRWSFDGKSGVLWGEGTVAGTLTPTEH